MTRFIYHHKSGYIESIDSPVEVPEGSVYGSVSRGKVLQFRVIAVGREGFDLTIDIREEDL